MKTNHVYAFCWHPQCILNICFFFQLPTSFHPLLPDSERKTKHTSSHLAHFHSDSGITYTNQLKLQSVQVTSGHHSPPNGFSSPFSPFDLSRLSAITSLGSSVNLQHYPQIFLSFPSPWREMMECIQHRFIKYHVHSMLPLIIIGDTEMGKTFHFPPFPRSTRQEDTWLQSKPNVMYHKMVQTAVKGSEEKDTTSRWEIQEIFLPKNKTRKPRKIDKIFTNRIGDKANRGRGNGTKQGTKTGSRSQCGRLRVTPLSRTWAHLAVPDLAPSLAQCFLPPHAEWVS